MSVAFDAHSAKGTTETGDFNWTHTPVGTPKGVIVYVICSDQIAEGESGDEISGVTYGGTAMSQVDGSPNVRSVGEAGRVYAFFLGSSIPTGAQTVQVTTGGSSYSKTGFCYTVTASTSGTAVADTGVAINSSSQSNPSDALFDNNNDMWACEAFMSGQDAVTGITPLSGWTSRAEHDFGSATAGSYSCDSNSTSSITVGWTQTTNDALCIAIALKEVTPAVLTPDAGVYTYTGNQTSLLYVPSGAVAFDAISNPTVGTGNLSWTHTPVGTPAGVLVYVIVNQASGSTDEVTSVTYGGASMTEVTNSPQIKSSEEMGQVHCFFIGNPAAGAQTVAVTVDATGSSKAAVAISVVSGSTTTKVKDTKYINDISQTNPTVATATGSGAALALGSIRCFVSIGFHSGLNVASGVTPFTDWAERYEHDFGAQIAAVYTYDILGTADVDSGWTQGADDALAITVAIARDNFNLPLDAGGYVVTGNAVALTKTSLLSVDAGAYALTGNAVTLARTYILTVDAGSYALTGGDVALTHGHALAVDAGSYVLTGNDVTLTKSASNYEMVVDAGAYVITGNDPSLTKQSKLSVDSGLYSITGLDVSLARALGMSVDAGSYSLTGNDATLSRTRVLAADAGSYTFNGNDVGLAYSGTIVPPAWSKRRTMMAGNHR